jgi:hypothetical protein
MSELFYEDCLHSKPIVDLCLYHAVKNPFNRIEQVLPTDRAAQGAAARRPPFPAIAPRNSSTKWPANSRK